MTPVFLDQQSNTVSLLPQSDSTNFFHSPYFSIFFHICLFACVLSSHPQQEGNYTDLKAYLLPQTYPKCLEHNLVRRGTVLGIWAQIHKMKNFNLLSIINRTQKNIMKQNWQWLKLVNNRVYYKIT